MSESSDSIARADPHHAAAARDGRVAPPQSPPFALPPEAAHWVVLLETAGSGRKTGARRLGGKAVTLGRLLREGFLVPRGFVIDSRHFTRALEAVLPRGHDLATLVRIAHTRAGVDRAARARDRVLAMTLPEGLQAALRVVWDALADGRWGLAVRSSASCEDTSETSLAGLASTVLGVRGPETRWRARTKTTATARVVHPCRSWRVSSRNSPR